MEVIQVLLDVSQTINNVIKAANMPSDMGADDLLPLLTCMLHQCIVLGEASRKFPDKYSYYQLYPDQLLDYYELFTYTNTFLPKHLLCGKESYIITLMISAVLNVK